MQLLMIRADLEDLPDIPLPEGYCIRTFRPGDENSWADILTAAEMGNWTRERIDRDFIQKPLFAPDRVFFCTFDGTPIGTATAWQDSSISDDLGYVHYVAVEPEHRGRKIGQALVVAVMRRFKELGYKGACLNTDDFRLPAIAVYLKLGFRPEIIEPNQHQRWAVIFRKLGRASEIASVRSIDRDTPPDTPD